MFLRLFFQSCTLVARPFKTQLLLSTYSEMWKLPSDAPKHILEKNWLHYPKSSNSVTALITTIVLPKENAKKNVLLLST